MDKLPAPFVLEMAMFIARKLAGPADGAEYVSGTSRIIFDAIRDFEEEQVGQHGEDQRFIETEQ